MSDDPWCTGFESCFPQAVKLIVMIFAVSGVLAGLWNPKSPLADKFYSGIRALGDIFITFGGVLASVPVIVQVIEATLAPAFDAVGSTGSVAGDMFVSVDMGGNQLSRALTTSIENHIVGTVVGYTVGPCMAFTLPVGINILAPKHRNTFALGVIVGLLLCYPTCVLIVFLLSISKPMVASSTEIRSTAAEDYQLNIDFGTAVVQLWPLLLFSITMSLCLFTFPKNTVRAIIGFGVLLDSGIKLVFVLSMFEYFTGLFVLSGAGWPFDDLLATESSPEKAIEISAMVAMMISGINVMVALLERFCGPCLAKLGYYLGIETPTGTAAVIASTSNIIAGIEFMDQITPADQILMVAFAVPAGFVLGDCLAYCSSFHGTMLWQVSLGKFVGGFAAIFAVRKLPRSVVDRVLNLRPEFHFVSMPFSMLDGGQEGGSNSPSVAPLLERYKTFFFACDDTIFEGCTQPVPGVQKIISTLRSLKKDIVYLSSVSSHSAEDLCQLLNSTGVEARLEECWPSSLYCARKIKEEHPEAKRVLVLGNPRLIAECEHLGFTVESQLPTLAVASPQDSLTTTSSASYDVVVIGEEMAFTMNILAGLSSVMQQNPAAFLYASLPELATGDSSDDRTAAYMNSGAMSILAAVEAAVKQAAPERGEQVGSLGVRPVVIGKPNAMFGQNVAKWKNGNMNGTIMLGVDPTSLIGSLFGMPTLLAEDIANNSQKRSNTLYGSEACNPMTSPKGEGEKRFMMNPSSSETSPPTSPPASKIMDI